MTMIVLFVSFIVLLGIGVPIAFAMGLSSVAALLADGTVPLLILPQRFFSSLDSFALLAIPLFILAGNLMNLSGITEAIVLLARRLVGHFRGGLGHVNVATSVLFSGISGSASADIAAVGGMLMPAMTREGYKPEWSAVITASSAIIGPIIPPSILMVIYGAMTGLSIGDLFLAGIVPGLVIAACLMVMVWLKADAIGAPRYERASVSEIGEALRKAGPALMMPVLIVGGIQSGVFSPTEAGIVAVAYGLVYGFIVRKLDLRLTYNFVLDAAIASSSILVILGGAALFSWLIARAGIPAQIASWLFALTDNGYLILVLVALFLLVVGMFVETISALILVVPILTPIASTYGFDPIHFAIVTVVTVLLGALTPPVAILLLLACRIGNVSYAKTMRPLIPFFAVLIAGLALIMFVPAITLTLPALF
ncbi:MAG: TRAP transporter large permease [Geminicoccaceae bacterium]|nr:TRAP transporter large permease [Geminicoccaceae bacterium]